MVTDGLTWMGAGLGVAAIGYLALALTCVAQFPTRGSRAPRALPPVSVLKPLCGAEPGLLDCLRSFCDQDYPVFQIVFAVREPDDPAIAVVQRLMRDYPDRDLTLVVDARIHGINLKVSNLIHARGAARHELLVVSDSDVRVAPDCLRRVVGALTPDAGAATCLYRAVPAVGAGPRLGALYVNDWFLTSAIVDATLNPIDYCFGPVTVVRSEALDAIGGFEALGDRLADDFELGRRISASTYTVALAPCLPEIAVTDDLRSLVAHELRWARTVRALKPLEHALSVVMQALPLVALLGLLAGSDLVLTLAAIGATLRVALHYQVRARLVPGDPPRPWLLPVRELLCFGIWCASYLGNEVRWRGRVLRIGDGGRLVAATRRDSGGRPVLPVPAAEDVAS